MQKFSQKLSLVFLSILLVSLSACSGMKDARKPSSAEDPFNTCHITWDSIGKIRGPTVQEYGDWFKKPEGVYFVTVGKKRVPLLPSMTPDKDHVQLSHRCTTDKNAPGCRIGIHVVKPAQECVCQDGKCASYCAASGDHPDCG
jgi:hypothetical protein